MNDRPAADLPEPYRILAVAIGAAIGIFLVLHYVAEMSPGEIALILGPMLVVAVPLLGYYLWSSRRADR